MRFVLPLLLAAAVPLCAHAQTPAPINKPASKVSKPAKAVPAVKAAGTKTAGEAEAADAAELDAERLAVAPLVLQGEAQCEFGHKVQVKEHPTLRGRFQLMFRGLLHTLTPHPTTTGVVRLEDKRSGLVWLQVPIKSMLMDSKKGQRVVDNCMHPTQLAEAEATRGQVSTSLQ